MGRYVPEFTSVLDTGSGRNVPELISILDSLTLDLLLPTRDGILLSLKLNLLNLENVDGLPGTDFRKPKVTSSPWTLAFDLLLLVLCALSTEYLTCVKSTALLIFGCSVDVFSEDSLVGEFPGRRKLIRPPGFVGMTICAVLVVGLRK